MADDRNALAAILAEQRQQRLRGLSGREFGNLLGPRPTGNLRQDLRRLPGANQGTRQKPIGRLGESFESGRGLARPPLSPQATAASRHRRANGGIALKCNRMSDDQQSIASRPGVGNFGASATAESCEFHPQSLPSSAHFSVTLGVDLARPQRVACIMLRKPPHQEQRLGRNSLGRRAGESLQAAARDGGILLHSELLLPAAQRRSISSAGFP